jgi:ABC-type Fe3+/spermidine/putrescine transport system ATPase subunit
MVLLEQLGIARLANRRPAELSGGQQQRVGLARALACEAGLYLFDEPTAHLDAPLRAVVQEEIAERRHQSGAAAIHATHDAAEALAIADRLVLIREGTVVQAGSPLEVYERPADRWAAVLTGPTSLLRAPVLDAADGQLTVDIGGTKAVVRSEGGYARGALALLVRPEWARLGGELPGRVHQVWFRGSHTDYGLATPVGEIQVRALGRPLLGVGDSSTWSLDRVWPLEAAD